MYTLAALNKTDTRQNCDAYQDAMISLMKENHGIVHIDCDLMNCIHTERLKNAFPDRVFNAGIAEENAMGAACGMAAAGLVPFVHTFGVFASRRILDQAYLSSGLSRLPVHVIGSDPGITAAFNGATHMTFEDCGIYMTIPNAVVVDPADYAQTFALTKKLADVPELSYMRLIRRTFKPVYEDGSDFEIGKGVLLKQGTDAVIIASGIMVCNALEAQAKLQGEGISVSVIDMHTWKPLDEELVLREAVRTGCAVTAENHQIDCGLGSAVANLLIGKYPVPLERIGNHCRYGKAGPQDLLEKDYQMTADDIIAAVHKAIVRKQG